MRIKICGITNEEDAFRAKELGADILGFIFADSPRRISPEKAKEIIAALPEHTITAGVFVDPTLQEVKDIIKATGITAVQLHGDEDNNMCRELSEDVTVIKAIRVSKKEDIEKISQYPDCYIILLDTFSKDKKGGTGKTFDWDIAVEAKKYNKPIMLSGGLSPENVADAIKKVEPYGVDASSCLEKHPGKKDHDIMERFFDKAIHSADQ